MTHPVTEQGKRDEIDRLRTELVIAYDTATGNEQEADRLRAENAKLRKQAVGNDALRAENAELRKGIQDYLDRNYDGPSLRKVGQCPHGIFQWDVCEACIDQHFRAILAMASRAIL
jgi:hypothetical protein